MYNSNTAHVLRRATTLVAAPALPANHNKAVGDHICDGGRSLVEGLCLSEPCTSVNTHTCEAVWLRPRSRTHTSLFSATTTQSDPIKQLYIKIK